MCQIIKLPHQISSIETNKQTKKFYLHLVTFSMSRYMYIQSIFDINCFQAYLGVFIQNSSNFFFIQ